MNKVSFLTGRDAACHVSTKTRCISMWQRVVIFLCASLCAATLSAQTWDIGSPTATDVTATLSNGTLTISGTGAMTDFAATVFIPWFSERANISAIIIENGITHLGNNAFRNVQASSVSIAGSVESIGNNVFRECSSLLSVIIPDNVISIGNDAFAQCSSLAAITIPGSVTSLGSYVFDRCTGLKSVTVGWDTPFVITNQFGLFDQVQTQSVLLVVPQGTTAAYQAAALWQNFNIVEPILWDCGAQGDNVVAKLIGNTLTISGSGDMANYSANQQPWNSHSGDITEVIIESGVTSIGDNAFSGCAGLASVTVHSDTPPNAGSTVFSGLQTDKIVLIVPLGAKANYETAIWQNFIVIEDNGALMPCGEHGSNLIATLIDGTLTIRGNGNMADYMPNQTTPWYNMRASIQSVIIEDGVASIGDFAFFNCQNLTSITIGKDVASISQTAFNGCYHLNAINVTTGNSAYSSVDDVLFNADKTMLIKYPNNKPDLSYSIPNGVISIGDFAFSTSFVNTLNTITIPQSVANVGEWVFDAAGLININVDEANNAFSSIDGVLFNKDKTMLIEYPMQKPYASYDIPEGVEIIGKYAFMGNIANGWPALTSITIPESVTIIDDYAFKGLLNIPSVTISENVTYIGEGAFAEWRALESVAIPGSVTAIGEYAFERCLRLASVTVEWDEPLDIPENVFDIYSPSFLVALIVPSGTEDDYAATDVWKDFYIEGVSAPFTGKCGDNLTWKFDVASGTLTIEGTGDMDGSTPWSYFREKIRTVIMLDGVTSIGNNAFSGCNNLISVTIPEGVTNIGNSAFYACSRLTSITIPAVVESIGYNAFNSCTRLTFVTVHWVTPLDIDGYNIFGSVNLSNVTLYVPEGTIEAYKNAPVWMGFGTITSNISTVPVTGVSLNKSILLLESGKSEQLIATVSPADADNDMLSWSSSDESVATVSQNGDVTGVGAGMAIITVVTVDGLKVANCIVSVTAPLQDEGTSVIEGALINVTASAGNIIINLYIINTSLLKSDGLEDYVLVATTVPDANGKYIFENLPEGVYKVQAVIDDFVSLPSEPIDLTGAPATGTVDFTADESGKAVTSGTPSVEDIPVSPTTSTGELFASELEIYPNPFRGAVRITGAGAVETRHATSVQIQMQIINVAGAIVHTQMITGDDETINLEHLPAGLYIFRFENDGNVRTVRAVKN